MTHDSLSIAAQAEYISSVFVKSGILAGGHVVEVGIESDRPTLLSRIIRLRLRYDHATGSEPNTIILKTGLENAASAKWNGGRQEVEFYTTIAPLLSAGIVPRCFDAHWDSETNWHLLLEDLSETHVVPTEWPLPPSQVQCERILAARARLHAAWWDDPRLGVSVGQWLDAEGINFYLQRLERNYAAFADRLGDNLSPERRDLFERLLREIPRLSARYRMHRHATIVQGDAHVWNCFLPRNEGADVRFFDWDSWRIHLGAFDLSYMMALHWYRDRRQRMEGPLLDHYHMSLLAHGVTGYDRRALQDDYRWCVLWQIAVPVMQAAAGIPPVIWWSHLERILIAVDDLDCRQLLT